MNEKRYKCSNRKCGWLFVIMFGMIGLSAVAQGSKFNRWMNQVRAIAAERNDGIKGDDQYFVRYFREGYTPLEAVRHWEADPWPNMGGGE
jgi:hypothetical protein